MEAEAAEAAPVLEKGISGVMGDVDERWRRMRELRESAG